MCDTLFRINLYTYIQYSCSVNRLYYSGKARLPRTTKVGSLHEQQCEGSDVSSLLTHAKADLEELLLNESKEAHITDAEEGERCTAYFVRQA